MAELTNSLAVARARRALEAAGLDLAMPLERASSTSNDVFIGPDHVIRVNRRLEPRLAREAALAAHLPPTVRYPEIVASGAGPHGADWLIQRRMPGQVLARAWPAMDPDTRRRAISELAAILRALHGTPAPPAVRDLDGSVPQLLSRETLSPVMPLLVAIDRLRSDTDVDRGLLAEVEALVIDTAETITPFSADTLIHGDLTFENVLWGDTGITALLDFEWARPGPPDLDLDVLLRFCAHPRLHVARDYEHLTPPDSFARVPGWLHEDYPELFGFPRQLDRVRLYSIAFDVRDLLLTPPTGPVGELDPDHALHRLRRTLDGRSDLHRLAGQPTP